MPDKILIIEDDPHIAQIEKLYLENAGFEAHIESNGHQGLLKAFENRHDLMILDLMLPGMDGTQIAKRFRERFDTPIIMVTARVENEDIIKGLGLGTDDYLTKPFSPSELVARVQAHLARYRSLKGQDKDQPLPLLHIGELTIDRDRRLVTMKDQEVSLKNKEYDLLLFLALHPGQVFHKETLYESVWGLDAQGDSRTVPVHINRLREKIEADPSSPTYIQTVWGAGYRLGRG